jgi:hypothetical protein
LAPWVSTPSKPASMALRAAWRKSATYRVADGHIVENWHLEDNLTVLQQPGVDAK